MSTVAHKTLAEALVAAQAEMPAVDKDAKNPHFNSAFTSLDHLIALTRPVLNSHGLALTQAPTHIDGTPALSTKLLHVSGESEEDVMPLLVSKSDMQGLGSALTYAKRYAWAAKCGISTEADDDGEQATASAANEVQVLETLLMDVSRTIGADAAAVKKAIDSHRSKPDFAAWLARQIAQAEMKAEEQSKEIPF